MITTEIPSGYCRCGCGQPMKTSPKSRTEKGWVKGVHRQFVAGHNMRLHGEQGSPLGRVLNGYLRERNLTQEQFGEALKRAGYPGPVPQQQLVSRWIRNPNQRLHPEFFRCAAKALRLTDEQWIQLLVLYGGPLK
jgi:hypothetical protein